MLDKLKLAYQAKVWRTVFLHVLIGCILGTSFVFAQVSDEEGLRQRKKRRPKPNTAQIVAMVPYFAIRMPLFLVAQGMKQSYFLARKAPNPRELLTSEDGLVGLYPSAGFGGRDGLIGELTFFHKRFVKRGNELRAHGSYSTSAFQNHYIRYRAYDLIGPVYLDIRGRYNVNTEEDFFGIGPDLSDVDGDGDEEGETNFRHEQGGADLTIGAKWQKYFHTQFVFNFTNHTIEEGEGSTPSTSEKFDEERAPGLEGAALLGVGGQLAFDTRDNDYYPSRGLYAAVSTTVFNETGESDIEGREYGFTRYNLEVSHYLTLFHRRILAVRLLGEINTAGPDKITPFFERASLGGKSNLRGYDVGRFRDKDLILLNLEYRYPIWEGRLNRYGGTDGVLFVDIGRVFDDLTEDTVKDYKVTYGAGIRARTTSGFLLRLDFAHSDEQNKIMFAFAPMF